MSGYAVIVGTTTLEDAITLLRVEAVHQGLELGAAMALLARRPAGTVGRVQRLPAELPVPGAVLRLDPTKPRFGQVTPADNSMAARRERRQRVLGSKP
jgi:hypothetical protein